MYSATITKSGQVTLPKELRDFLGVKPGQKIIFNKKGDSVFIPRRMSDEEFLEKLDELKTPKTKAFIKKYGAKLAKKSISEIKSDWAKSPAGQKYLEEKYAAY